MSSIPLLQLSSSFIIIITDIISIAVNFLKALIVIRLINTGGLENIGRLRGIMNIIIIIIALFYHHNCSSKRTLRDDTSFKLFRPSKVVDQAVSSIDLKLKQARLTASRVRRELEVATRYFYHFHYSFFDHYHHSS